MVIRLNMPQKRIHCSPAALRKRIVRTPAPGALTGIGTSCRGRLRTLAPVPHCRDENAPQGHFVHTQVGSTIHTVGYRYCVVASQYAVRKSKLQFCEGFDPSKNESKHQHTDFRASNIGNEEPKLLTIEVLDIIRHQRNKEPPANLKFPPNPGP